MAQSTKLSGREVVRLVEEVYKTRERSLPKIVRNILKSGTREPGGRIPNKELTENLKKGI